MNWNWQTIAILVGAILVIYFAFISPLVKDFNQGEEDKEAIRRDWDNFKATTKQAAAESKKEYDALPKEEKDKIEGIAKRASEVLLRKTLGKHHSDIDYILKGPQKTKEQPRPAPVDSSKNTPSSSSQKRRSGLYVGDDDE